MWALAKKFAGKVMNLVDLVGIGCAGASSFENAVKCNIQFGESNFDVYIKPAPSVADFEFVYAAKGEDDSYGARRVARFVMLDKGERIPYETAKQLKTELVTVLTNAINSVHGPDKYQKKN